MKFRRAGTPTGTRGTRGTRSTTVISLVTIVGLSLTLFAGQAMAKGKGHPAVAKAPKVDKKEVHACGIIYEKAKERAATAHLREAREMLGKCALPKCGSFLQQECTTLFTQLDADVPTVVPVVTDDTGSPHALVEVRMDGELLTSKLDGHALAVDPGKHVFSFSTDAGVFATQKLMIVQGQRNRSVAALLHSKKGGAAGAVAADQPAGESAATETAAVAKPPEGGAAAEKSGEPEAAETEVEEDETPTVGQAGVAAGINAPVVRVVTRRVRRGASWPAYTLAGVGVVGIAGYVLLSTWGKKDNDMITSTCGATQQCLPASLDHIRKVYLEANISGAVGLAALAASTYLYFRTTTVTERVADRTAGVRSRPRPAVSIQMLDVQPTQSGAVAMIGGAF